MWPFEVPVWKVSLISTWSFILFGEERAVMIVMRDRGNGEIREKPSSAGLLPSANGKGERDIHAVDSRGG